MPAHHPHTDTPPTGGTPRALPGTGHRRLTQVVLPCLLVAAVIALYGPLVRFPYVQDDWRLIHRFMFGHTGQVIGEMLSPAGRFFYRPLAGVYFLCVYRLFGLDAAGFHILSLLLLAGSALGVVALAFRLTGDRAAAWGSGFLFAGAANVQFEPQMWMVGTYDTGAVFFSILCLLALLHGRYRLSALAMAAALACKESASLLIVAAAVWIALLEKGGTASKLEWHGAVFLVFAAARLAGISPFSLPAADPYAARLLGGHVLTNAALYGTWAIQAVTPLKNIAFTEAQGRAALVLAACAPALAALIAALAARRGQLHAGTGMKAGVCIVVWFLMMLIPPLTLKAHIVRYYLVAALPPLAIGVMLALASLARVTFRSPRVPAVLCALFVAACLGDALVMTETKMSLARADGVHSTSHDGDNHLVRKATVVKETRASLQALLPGPPPHTVIWMEGVETGCFEGRYGLQAWYRDSTLLLAKTVSEAADSGGLVNAVLTKEDPGQTLPAVVAVPARSVVHVREEDGTMILVRDSVDGRR